MRTVDNSASADQGRWAKLRSDAALLLRFARMIVHYFTAGHRLRRAYRKCESRGEVFWVDEDPTESERRIR